MNTEMGRIWKEAVLAFFEVLSHQLPGGTEESMKTVSQVRLFAVRNLNPGPSEYESGVLITWREFR